MEQVKVIAPAKINLSLDITGVDEKGYHLLDMVMQTISVFEKISAFFRQIEGNHSPRIISAINTSGSPPMFFSPWPAPSGVKVTSPGRTTR